MPEIHCDPLETIVLLSEKIDNQPVFRTAGNQSLLVPPESLEPATITGHTAGFHPQQSSQNDVEGLLNAMV